jgi:hypothetical protein
VAHPESHIDWLSARPNSAAALPAVASVPSGQWVAPARRAPAVDYRQLATVGRRS